MENEKHYYTVVWTEPHMWDLQCVILWETSEGVDVWMKSNRPNAIGYNKYIALTEKEYHQMREDE